MKPVMQTVIGSGEEGEPLGNCMRAVIASLFEVSLEEVPAFDLMKSGEWQDPWLEYIDKMGYEYRGMAKESDFDNPTKNRGVDGYLFVGGGSPRGFKRGHAVIYKDGKLAHDPHPSGEGVTEVEYFYMIERKKYDG